MRDDAPVGTTARAVVLAAAACALLAGCGNDGDDSAAGEPPVDAAETAPAATSAAGGAVGEGTGQADLPAERQIVVTGQVSVRVEDVAAAVDVVRERMVALGGYLAGSDVALESDRPTAELVFRVPTDRYDAAVTAAAESGLLLSQQASTDDVTREVVDLDARAGALETSIERLTTFLAQASDVEDLARLEAELVERETALDQIRAQQRTLADRVADATLAVRLSTQGRPAAQDDEDDSGFVAGLEAGARLLVGAAVVVVTVLGFLLPLVPVAAAVAAVVLVVRRVRGGRRDEADDGGPDDGPPPPAPEPQHVPADPSPSAT